MLNSFQHDEIRRRFHHHRTNPAAAITAQALSITTADQLNARVSDSSTANDPARFITNAAGRSGSIRPLTVAA